MQHHPQVDVLILNHNGQKFLDECILSVKKSTYPNFKIYVIDNASTDNDVAYLQQHYADVNIIQNPLNNGFCAAYNLAFAVCKGTYFLCLNNDVSVKPDWLDHLVRAAEEDKQISALQPKMVSYFDEKQFEYAGSSGGMLDIYGYPFLRGRVFATIEPDNGQYNDESEVFWTCGAAMFIRAEVLRESGTFDEAIVHHMDEIDLNWRMHLAGYKAKVIPQSVILHIGGATIPAESFKKMYWNHRNSLYMMLKNYGLRNVITKAGTHFFLDYMAILHSIIIGRSFTRTKAILSAHFWIITNIPLILKKRREVQNLRKVSDAEIQKKMFPKSVALLYFLWNITTYTELQKRVK